MLFRSRREEAGIGGKGGTVARLEGTRVEEEVGVQEEEQRRRHGAEEMATARACRRGGWDARSRRGKEGDTGEEGLRDGKKKKKKIRKRRRSQGPKRKGKNDLLERWRGLIAKRGKRGRVAARCKGVGGKEPVQELGFWRLDGLWAGVGLLSLVSKLFFFCKLKFGN